MEYNGRVRENRRRVVVTGMGAITPLGNSVAASWDALLAGKSGTSLISSFDSSRHEVKVAAEIKDFDPRAVLDHRDAKRTDRYTQFAIHAAFEAIAQSGLTIRGEFEERVGVLMGSGQGGFITTEDQHTVLMEQGPDRVSPLTVPMLIADMASGYLSILIGAKGPNYSVVSACATGANAIGDATEIIRRGAADAMIAGSSEAAITPFSVAAFGNSGAMCKAFAESPERASRPFDARRAGFVMGEGAGALVLEGLDFALARGATPLAEIVGYGLSGDAYHITSPNPTGEGVARAMRAAMVDAGLRRDQIGYVNAHATSTQVGDKAEIAAIRLAFGEHAERLPVSSTKASTGHLIGAAGSVEGIFAMLAIQNGILPASINQDELDPECDLDIIRNEPRRQTIDYALSNNSGFGGHNAALIFGRYR